MKLLKWIAAIAGALLTGAVGSGIWDLALKPLVLLLWRASAALGGGALSSVRDTPYREAASGSPHDSLLYLASLLVAAWFGREWAGIHPPWTIPANALPDEERRVRRQHRWVASAATLALFFFLYLQIGQIRQVYKITDDFQRNMSVLDPLVEPRVAVDLRLAFSKMQSRQDYLALTTRMTELAQRATVALPRLR